MSIIVGLNGKQTVRIVRERMHSLPDVYQKFYSNRRPDFWRKNDMRMRRRFVPTADSTIIRWACGAPINGYSTLEYNTPSAIGRASDKAKARRIMRDVGVPIPETLFRGEIYTSRIEYPVIARPSKHRGGKPLFVCNNGYELERAMSNGCTYVQKIYPKTREFRAHCAHGKILVLQEKIGTEEQKRKLVWNHQANNFYFKTLHWDEYKRYICKPALDAMDAIGLDFGGVDIMTHPTDSSLPKAVILEINTSPSLCDYTSERYAKYFDWLLSSSIRREHFTNTGWSVGKSYAFKNFQLEE